MAGYFTTQSGGGSGSGATSIVITSSDNTLQQNGPSSYDPDTKQISVNLSATNAGEGGLRNAKLVSSTVLQPGESITLTVTWDVAFTDINYNPTVSAFADTNLPMIVNPISGGQTTTNMQVRVTNNSNFPTATITVTAIAQSNT